MFYKHLLYILLKSSWIKSDWMKWTNCDYVHCAPDSVFYDLAITADVCIVPLQSQVKKAVNKFCVANKGTITGRLRSWHLIWLVNIQGHSLICCANCKESCEGLWHLTTRDFHIHSYVWCGCQLQGMLL